MLRRHRGTKPPVRRIKGTNVYESRPHLDEVVTSKVWRIPDGTGFVGIIGARSGNARHAHLLENPTADRYTKLGQYRGRMPGYHLLDKAQAVARQEALYQLEATVKNGLANLGNT
jgi:hypothetical protein